MPLVALLGLIAAAVSSAISLRNLRGTSTPYALPLAVAVLKLPSGAVTAVLGLLLMRGGFVPGLSALDTPAQILAWAVLFGSAQQLFTRFVDARAHTVLDEVGGQEQPRKPDTAVVTRVAPPPEGGGNGAQAADGTGATDREAAAEAGATDREDAAGAGATERDTASKT